MIPPSADRILRRRISSGLQKSNNALKTLGVIQKSFFCSALFSGDHVGILCDGTVVCSCFSIKKEVVLGNLKHQRLEDVWLGSRAEELRAEFRRGRLPSRLCAVCRYFSRVQSSDGLGQVAPFPAEAHVETTAACTLRCLSCDREGIRHARDETNLDRRLYERLVDEICSRGESRTLNLIGGGEPFMTGDFHEFIRYAKSRNSSLPVHTSTNGLFLDSDEKRMNIITSGLDCMEFTISGSSQQSYARYHQGGDFHTALSNMRRLIEQREAIGVPHRPFVIWKYLLFNWNDSREDTERASRLSQEIGVDRLSFVPTYSPLAGTSLRYLAKRILNRRHPFSES